MNKSEMNRKDSDMLGVRWQNRPMTASEYLAFSKALVRKLMQFDPVFKGLIVIGLTKPGQYQPIAEDLSDFDEKVYRYVVEETKIATPESTYVHGFDSVFSNNKISGKGDFKLTISCGNTGAATDLINIEFPGARHPKCHDYAYLSELMKLLIAYCEPDNAFVTYGRIIGQRKQEIKLEYKLRKPAGHTGTHLIGWLNYYTDPAVKSRLPDDIESEVLATGGTLFSMKRTLPSADNEEDVAIAMRIRDALSQPEAIAPYWQSYQRPIPEETY